MCRFLFPPLLHESMSSILLLTILSHIFGTWCCVDVHGPRCRFDVFCCDPLQWIRWQRKGHAATLKTPRWIPQRVPFASNSARLCAGTRRGDLRWSPDTTGVDSTFFDFQGWNGLDTLMLGTELNTAKDNYSINLYFETLLQTVTYLKD